MTGRLIFYTYVAATIIATAAGFYLYIFRDRFSEKSPSMLRYVHSFTSTITLIPFYIALILLYSLVLLLIVFLGMISIDSNSQFIIYIGFCVWLFALTYTPNKILRVIFDSVNNVSPVMRLTDSVGVFANHLIKGKVLAYLISSIFIIFTSYCKLSGNDYLQTYSDNNMSLLNTLFNISNYAIVTFIALDKAVETLIKKYKANA